MPARKTAPFHEASVGIAHLCASACGTSRAEAARAVSDRNASSAAAESGALPNSVATSTSSTCQMPVWQMTLRTAQLQTMTPPFMHASHEAKLILTTTWLLMLFDSTRPSQGDGSTRTQRRAGWRRCKAHTLRSAPAAWVQSLPAATSCIQWAAFSRKQDGDAPQHDAPRCSATPCPVPRPVALRSAPWGGAAAPRMAGHPRRTSATTAAPR